ncbi:MAG: DNA repair protein RecN [Bacteroidales bacterium]|nr:DNA repair protein RecN [Bacteroidales bacterium]
MLQFLSIENYALIDHLEFRPGAGLTVITGETGAGKSIIMGALGLILGQRADAKAVRNGATKCVIEAQFDISAYALEDFFRQNDLEYDAHDTILRREIYATGKSRAFVNDIPVQLTTLRQLGSSLIDIHSQHQNLLLGQDAFQLSVIDALAGNHVEYRQYRTVYDQYVALNSRLKTLKAEAARDAQEADYIRFQFQQLDSANLVEGEQEELEAEQELLSHAEDIKSSLGQMHEALDGEDDSMVQVLKNVARQAHELSRIYPDIAEIAQRLESDYIDLKDIADEVDGRTEEVNFDPQRMEQVEERLSLLYSLQKKHGKTSVEDLIALRDQLFERMQHIEGSDEEIDEMEKQLKELTQQATRCAAALTATRVQAAAKFQKALIDRVTYLGMPNLRFQAIVSPLTPSNSSNPSNPSNRFSATGADSIDFLFSANKNQPLRPAGEVASGGEISRLMLGIKSLVASARTLPTIIFDEIDTGVSGDIADRMGQVMKELSTHLQVITITHLPQVAGKGNQHFRVFKADTDEQTITHIEQLSPEQRIQEIARMLSGSDITPEALANARTLITE